jgi:hypothetical protein
MKTATRQQNAKITGATPPQRAYIRATLADYANTRALVAHALGRSFDAVREARAARTLDRTIPEVHYNIGVLMLENAEKQRPGRSRTARIRRAQKSLRKAYAFDPAFREAQAMLGVAMTMAGDCEKGSATIRDALAPHPGEHRLYPMRTGPGDRNSAALHRRRRIETASVSLDPSARLAACEAKPQGSSRG